MWMRLWGHMAHVSVTTPVGFANLRARLPFGLISLTRRYVQIEQPLPSFCVGNAAPPDVVRPTLVFVHPLLLPGQRLTAHVVRVILGPRHALLLAMDARPRRPVLVRRPCQKTPFAHPFHASSRHLAGLSRAAGFEASITVEHDYLHALSFDFPLDCLDEFVLNLALQFLSTKLLVQLTVTLACHPLVSGCCLCRCKNKRPYSFQ